MAAEVLELDGHGSRIGARQRLFGADLGAKTIGLALSDVESGGSRRRLSRSGARNLTQRRGAARLAFMDEFDAAALIIGLPL
jgi:RNase H-fold protein (predicted Holliday junction resolvase)